MFGLRPPAGADTGAAQMNDAQANDYFVNAAARMGWGTPSLTEATEYVLERLTYDYWLMITLYRNHWLARRIVDVPARDMVRAWPRLTSDIDPDDLTQIDKVIRKTQTKTKILESIQWARLFGGAGALIVIDGQENILDEPLDLDSIEIGSFRGLIPFDRWAGIWPKGDVGGDISKPLEFNLPRYYEIQNSLTGSYQFKIHASRIVRFTGPPVPQPEYQAQSYWGISALEPVYEEIRKRDNMSWNILSLTYRANLIGLQIPDMAAALSGAGMSTAALQQFYNRMQSLNHLMSNQSLVMLPKDGSMSQVSYGFGGLSECYQMSQMDVAGAAEIPVSRLYGRTVSGLAQGNEADERIYEERIAMDQDNQLRPMLETLYQVICMSCLGEVPDDLDLKFPSIRVLDQREKADLATSIGTNINSLFGSGIITKVQALKEIKQSSDITEIGTNITDEDIEKAEKEQEVLAEAAKIQAKAAAAGSGLPGAPGGPGEAGGEAGEGAEPKLQRAADSRHSNEPKTTSHYDFAGIPIAVEYPAGKRRTFRNDAGDVVYDRMMKWDYGFIEDTAGRDGDEIDVVVGPDEGATHVFVADMIDMGQDVDQRENEDKVLLGFSDEQAAEDAFLTMYPRTFFGGMTVFTVEDFREKWLAKQPARAADAAFEENKHHRGQPKNAGQFGPGGGSKAAPKSKPAVEAPGQQAAVKSAMAAATVEAAKKAGAGFGSGKSAELIKAFEAGIKNKHGDKDVQAAVDTMVKNGMNPAVIDALPAVRIVEKPTGFRMKPGETLAGAYSGDGRGGWTIFLNQDDQGVDGGRLGTAIHEYGHHVFDRMTEGEIWREMVDGGHWDEKAFNSSLDAADREYEERDSKAWEVVTREGKRLQVLRPEAVKTAISDYALQSRDEWHAEAFRVFQSGGAGADRLKKIAPKTHKFWQSFCGEGFKAS